MHLNTVLLLAVALLASAPKAMADDQKSVGKAAGSEPCATCVSAGKARISRRETSPRNHLRANVTVDRGVRVWRMVTPETPTFGAPWRVSKLKVGDIASGRAVYRSGQPSIHGVNVNKNVNRKVVIGSNTLVNVRVGFIKPRIDPRTVYSGGGGSGAAAKPGPRNVAIGGNSGPRMGIGGPRVFGGGTRTGRPRMMGVGRRGGGVR